MPAAEDTRQVPSPGKKPWQGKNENESSGESEIQPSPPGRIRSYLAGFAGSDLRVGGGTSLLRAFLRSALTSSRTLRRNSPRSFVFSLLRIFSTPSEISGFIFASVRMNVP